MCFTLSRLADCERLAQQPDRVLQAKFRDRVVGLPLQALGSFFGIVLVALRHHGLRKCVVPASMTVLLPR